MDTTETSGKTLYEQEIACRVAYILDNDQPVLCTLIGDQPLFYADEIDELDFEEEEAFIEDENASDLLFRLTQQDLQEKAKKQKSKLTAFVTKHRYAPEEVFAQNAAAFGYSIKTEEKESKVEGLLGILRKSRLASALLSFAIENEIELKACEHIDGVTYDRQQKAIFIHPCLEKGVALVALVQELRRVWQHKNGILINPMTFQPDDAIIVNRAQTADLNIVTIRAAWELQLDQEYESWRHIAGSSMADIAYAFAQEIRKDFRSLNNGEAMQTAFERWFLSDRCKVEDRRLIQNMLADYAGHVFESAEASHMVSIDVVTRLGDLPFGRNYLSGFAASIIGDPLYTEVRDRSSANFLWFIKFESAFRDKERSLKPEGNSDTMKPSIRTTLFGSSEEEDYETTSQSGDVVDFPALSGFDRSDRARASRIPGRENVVELFARD